MEEREIIPQIPQAAGQAGVVSGQVLPSGWAACWPRLRPAVSLSVGLCWRRFGVAPCPLLQCPGFRACFWPSPGRGHRAMPAPSRSPVRGLGPSPSLGLFPALRLIRWGKTPSPGCLPLPAGRPQASGLSQAALLEIWWLCCCAVGQGDRGRVTRPGKGGDGLRWEMRRGGQRSPAGGRAGLRPGLNLWPQIQHWGRVAGMGGPLSPSLGSALRSREWG